MFGFTDVTVIVDGAVDEERVFNDEDSLDLDAYIERQRIYSEDDGSYTQIYLIHHDHDEDDECECVQYITDHHPQYEWNAPE